MNIYVSDAVEDIKEDYPYFYKFLKEHCLPEFDANRQTAFEKGCSKCKETLEATSLSFGRMTDALTCVDMFKIEVSYSCQTESHNNDIGRNTYSYLYFPVCTKSAILLPDGTEVAGPHLGKPLEYNVKLRNDIKNLVDEIRLKGTLYLTSGIRLVYEPDRVGCAPESGFCSHPLESGE